MCVCVCVCVKVCQANVCLSVACVGIQCIQCVHACGLRHTEVSAHVCTCMHTCACCVLLFAAQCLKNSSEDKPSQKEWSQQQFCHLVELPGCLPHPACSWHHREMGVGLPMDSKLPVPLLPPLALSYTPGLRSDPLGGTHVLARWQEWHGESCPWAPSLFPPEPGPLSTPRGTSSPLLLE